MTGLAAIDESGDTGENGSRYFVMAALITSRSRHFLNASKIIDNRFGETKYYNADRPTRTKVLRALAQTDATIVRIVVDKWDYESVFYGQYKNKLYETVFSGLISAIDDYSPCRSLNIMLDRTSSISIQKMLGITESMENVKVNSCKKYDSCSNKCIQLADFTVGAIREKYENGNEEYYRIIEKSIHCP